MDPSITSRVGPSPTLHQCPVALHGRRYQTINHGVEPKDNALGGDVAGCGSCHQGLAPTGTTARLDTDSLGYGPRTARSVVVGTNKTDLGGNLENSVASAIATREMPRICVGPGGRRHVSDKKKDCAACHNFSRPERRIPRVSN